MKILKIILSVFLPALFLLPIAPVFAQNVAGTYWWIGAGCRDSDLSDDSHESRAKTPNPFRITTSELILNRDGSLSITIEEVDAGERKEKSETGTYVVENNEVSMRSPNQKGGPPLVMNIVGENLILDSRQVTDHPDADDSYNDDLCDSGKVFVFIFGSI